MGATEDALQLEQEIKGAAELIKRGRVKVVSATSWVGGPTSANPNADGVNAQGQRRIRTAGSLIKIQVDGKTLPQVETGNFSNKPADQARAVVAALRELKLQGVREATGVLSEARSVGINVKPTVGAGTVRAFSPYGVVGQLIHLAADIKDAMDPKVVGHYADLLENFQMSHEELMLTSYVIYRAALDEIHRRRAEGLLM